MKIYVSADYTNEEQYIFCDDAGFPVKATPGDEFAGVASFQGKELIDQFSEIHPTLITGADEYLEALATQSVDDSVPAETSIDPVAEEVVTLPTETSVETAVEIVPEPSTEQIAEPVTEEVAIDQQELIDLGVPTGLLDELASVGLGTKESVLKFHADHGLQTIDGIGKASEEKILAALA